MYYREVNYAMWQYGFSLIEARFFPEAFAHSSQVCVLRASQ